MIFTAEHARMIASGRKTQTRRKRDPRSDRCHYQPGRAYRVQPGRGKRGMFQITVRAVRPELLGDITHEDARREGFRTTDEYRAWWKRCYGQAPLDQPVWVIDFDLGDRTDSPNLLVPAGGHVAYVHPPGSNRWTVDPRDHSQDYTESSFRAMRGEPEALTQAQLAALTRSKRLGELTSPQRALRDPIARIRAELDEMARTLENRPNRAARKALVRVQHHINALERQLPV